MSRQSGEIDKDIINELFNNSKQIVLLKFGLDAFWGMTGLWERLVVPLLILTLKKGNRSSDFQSNEPDSKFI